MSAKRTKKQYRPPQILTADAQKRRPAVLLACTGQYDCGNVGYPGCCAAEDFLCEIEC